MAKVSVIIPVYNVEKYLRECLDSVMNQTLKDIEVICINDGSTDNSLAILEEYAAQDKRIVIIDHHINKGLVAARKNGVMAATSKYIIHVDSDDWIEPDTCENAYKLITQKHVDILQFSIQFENFSSSPDVNFVWTKKYFMPFEERLENFNILRHFHSNTPISVSLFGKIFSAALSKKVYGYVEDRYIFVGEDHYTHFIHAFFAESYIGINTKPLYHYRYGMGIGNKDVMSIQKFECYCEMSRLADYLQAFLTEQSAFDVLYDSYMAFSGRLIADCCNHYLHRIGDADKKAAGTLLLKYWEQNPVFEKTIGKVLGMSREELFEISFIAPEYIRHGKAYSQNGLLPKVSVIIPVYNTEPYLRDSLDCIVTQTLKDIEIICINDGSTDTSLAILEEIADKDDRVTIISSQNYGQSCARNRGIATAVGEYVYFFDSDDLLEPNALYELYCTASSNDLDILFFEGLTFYDSEELETRFSVYAHLYENKAEITGVQTGKEIFCKFVEANCYTVSPCMQFIRLDSIHRKDLQFYPGIIHEDNLFTFKAILQAERTEHINKKFFKRRIREDSTVTRRKSFKNLYGYLICYINMISFASIQPYEAKLYKDMVTVLNGGRGNVKRIYSNIEPAERNKTRQMNDIEKMWLSLCLNEAPAAPHTPQVSNEAALLRTTWSYRIGMFITWFPRKIRGGIRCCKKHGCGYTFKYLRRKCFGGRK